MSDSISLPPIELNMRVPKITSKQLPTVIQEILEAIIKYDQIS